MGEYNPYLDPIGFEEERLRLWRLYHQYSRPSDHNYRITLVRQIVVLHGGYAQLPRLSERQKTILEMYYERNISNASIGMRIGAREAIVQKEHTIALHLLEYVNDESTPEHRIIPIHAPRVSSAKQSRASAPQARTPRKKPELEGENLITAFLADRGNKKLKDQLVFAWMPLVHYVLQKKVYLDLAKFEYEDYVTMGTIGLLDAIEKYDPSNDGHASFKTYATNRIKFAVQNSVKDEMGNRSAQLRAMSIKRDIEEIDELEKAGKIDEKMSYRRTKLQLRLEHIRLAVQTDSLDRPLGYQNDGNPVFLGDLVAHPESTAEYVDMSIQIEILSKYLHSLTAREQEILYYFLYEDLTSTMIGRKYGMSKNAIEDRINAALAKLKQAFFSTDEPENFTQKKIFGKYDPHSQEFQSALALLPYKQWKIFCLREVEGLTLEATGKQMGFTRERVRQIALQASANLIRHLEK